MPKPKFEFEAFLRVYIGFNTTVIVGLERLWMRRSNVRSDASLSYFFSDDDEPNIRYISIQHHSTNEQYYGSLALNE